MNVTKYDIVALYNFLLEREPEGERIILEKMKCGTINNLVTELISSEEFAQKHPLAPSKANAWVIVEDPEGFRIFVNLADMEISWNIIQNKFERAERKFIKKYLKEGDTALDIGANIGFFSMLMSKLVGREGRVLGFEPLPFLYEAACRSRVENDFTQCTMHNVALGSLQGRGTLVYAPDSPNWGGGFISPDDSVLHGHAGLVVPVTPLASYLHDLSIDFIKIDVEGSEYMVLQPARDYLNATRPIILTEIHRAQLQRVSNVDPKTYISFFKDMNYTCHVLNQDGEVGEHFSGDEEFIPINVVCLPQ